MNGLQVFRHNEFGELNVLEIEGKTYFPATTCAKSLGYSNARDAIATHCRWVVKRDVPHPQNPGKTMKMNFIPEGDLYRLITHSRLPAAERFEKWVFDEVLPAIRRQDAYIPNMESIVAQAVQQVVPQVMAAVIPYLVTVGNQPKKRVRRRVTSLVEQLEIPLRMEMDEMIMDVNNSYVNISEYFRDTYGVLISKSSIGRYAQRLYETMEAQERTLPNKVYVDTGKDDAKAYLRNGYDSFIRNKLRPDVRECFFPDSQKPIHDKP